jgi:hypothetical protein
MAEYPLPTRVERERVQGLRAMLRDARLSLPPTMTLPELGGEERTLLRFTRARRDTDKSFAMLRKSLRWREESGANDCLGAPMSDAHAALLAQIPGFYVGFAKGGHPVFLDHTAVVPWDKILSDMGMQTFLDAQVQCLEWMQMVVYREASRRAGRPITQGVNVWDMKGLTLAKFTSKVREISSATSRIAQDNYPESLAAAYVVNAPSYFTIIWAVISSFLDPKTVAKVHIYGSGPKMARKLRDALGEDCFITEAMVCCRKHDVGAAERRMGLVSAMAATQTWIRERMRVNNDDANLSASIVEGRPSPADGLDINTETRGSGSEADAFFDAEEDAFSVCSEELRDSLDEITGQPYPRNLEEEDDATSRAEVEGAAGADTRWGASVKLIESGLETSSGGGGPRDGALAGGHDLEHEEKQDEAAQKRCCGCC